MFGSLLSAWKTMGNLFGRKKKTPGLYTEGGQTFGEESLDLAPELREPLAPEEIERRRAAVKTEKPRTFLAGLGRRASRYVLGEEDPRRRVAWRSW